jgi:hypothetical protein
LAHDGANDLGELCLQRNLEDAERDGRVEADERDGKGNEIVPAREVERNGERARDGVELEARESKERELQGPGLGEARMIAEVHNDGERD